MIIGLSGTMGVGKSTAVEVLRGSAEGRPVFNVKFAQPLYDIQEMVYDRISPVFKRPPEFVKDRKLLQWLGTEWGRDSISKTLWVDLWKARTTQILGQSPGAVVVCDDVRFDNEADAIHHMGGQVILLTGKRTADRAAGGVGIQGHSSEAGIAAHLVDMSVANDGTLDAFKAKLCALYRDVLTEHSK